MSTEELSMWFDDHALRNGETIWNRYIVQGTWRLSLPLIYTSWLAREITASDRLGAFAGSVDVRRRVSISETDDVKIAFNEDESFGWDRRCTSETQRHASRSFWDDNFLRIHPLENSLNDMAPFVCPFCKYVNAGTDNCQHLVVSGTSVSLRFFDLRIDALFTEMKECRFNCNIMNLDIPGLRIKMPSDFIGSAEWFRFGYWYAAHPRVIDHVCDILEAHRLYMNSH